LQKGQLSSRELISGDVLVNPIQKDAPITISAFDNPYSRPGRLHEVIAQRGIEPPAAADDIAVPGDSKASARALRER
jgi:hypothetical protein